MNKLGTISAPTTEPLRETTIDLPPPPSVNRTRKLNRGQMMYYANWLIDCHNTVTKQWAAAKLRGTSRPTFGEARVHVHVLLNEKIKLRDADNGLKSVLDYLKRIEIIRDDSKQYVRRITVEWVEPNLAPEGVRLTVVRA